MQGSKCIGCATIDCQDGFRCVEKPRPRCVPIIGGGGGGCACTLEFRPVCCMGRDGRTSTKGNRCACTGCNSGGIVMSEGECPKIEDENGCGCPAPRGFGIVCCKKNGERFFSKSTCTCECGGGQAVSGDFCTGMFGDIGRVIA